MPREGIGPQTSVIPYITIGFLHYLLAAPAAYFLFSLT